LIGQFPYIFPNDLPPGLPPERPQDHRIKLEPSAQPTVRTQWRLMQPELQELRDQQDYLLVKGFVRPSTSSFAALIFFTPKKDGGLRMCIDYRALNRVTITARRSLFLEDRPSQRLPLDSSLRRRLLQDRILYSLRELRIHYHAVRFNECPLDVPADDEQGA
ncbi:hypothetical protein CLOP_g991, partial [Closterium sp. NIES-67]